MLAERGAARLFPKGQGDVSNDFEKQYEDWHTQVWPNVIEAFGLEIDSQPEPANHSLTVQYVKGLMIEASPNGVSDNHEEKLLGVLHQNSAELVERVLTRLGLDRNTQIIIGGKRTEVPHLPLDFPVRVWDLLSISVNLVETLLMLSSRN
jgi:cytochrome P450 / NADPH-cytochrome P450 reductase